MSKKDIIKIIEDDLEDIEDKLSLVWRKIERLGDYNDFDDDDKRFEELEILETKESILTNKRDNLEWQLFQLESE